jgi:hypothetical protein
MSLETQVELIRATVAFVVGILAAALIVYALAKISREGEDD